MCYKALRAVRNFVLESATRCKETPCMKASARLYTERSEVSYTKFQTRSEAKLNTRSFYDSYFLCSERER